MNDFWIIKILYNFVPIKCGGAQLALLQKKKKSIGAQIGTTRNRCNLITIWIE